MSIRLQIYYFFLTYANKKEKKRIFSCIQPSDVSRQMSAVRCQQSDVSRQMSDVSSQMSAVRCQAVCGGESGGNGRTCQLAERFGLCDPFAERGITYVTVPCLYSRYTLFLVRQKLSKILLKILLNIGNIDFSTVDIIIIINIILFDFWGLFFGGWTDKINIVKYWQY